MQKQTEHPGSRSTLDEVVDLDRHPIGDSSFRAACKGELDLNGVLLLPGFLTPGAIEQIASEGDKHHGLAYYTVNDHNIYLKPDDPGFPGHHPRNRKVASSKGCITTDQIPGDSSLRTLYDSVEFKSFLCIVLGEQQMHRYADSLSSINLHYASAGQELGWHFDNSSFAITLLVQKPQAGGIFEYVKGVRNADAGDMNYEQAGQILDGKVPVQTLDMDAGSLVLFRGRNSIHRVTPTVGDITRMLVVLAYNTEPGISLSESARMTFYGRLG